MLFDHGTIKLTWSGDGLLKAKGIGLAEARSSETPECACCESQAEGGERALMRRVLAVIVAGVLGFGVYAYSEEIEWACAVVVAVLALVERLGLIRGPYEPSIRDLMHSNTEQTGGSDKKR